MQDKVAQATRADGTVDLATVRKLTLEDIIQAQDIHDEEIYVPEWNGKVTIRPFTKAEQMAVREEATDPETNEIDETKLELLMFIHGVKEPQFNAAHIDALRTKSAGAIDRVLKQLMVASGLDTKAVARAERRFPQGLGSPVPVPAST